MYSQEIDKFLRERNFHISREEYEELSPQKNIQISRISYDTSSDSFHLYTYDGYDWIFYIKRE